MKFNIAKTAFLQALQTVQNVVAAKPSQSLPVLMNVLINADKSKLWFTTTDLELTVKCGVEASVSKTGGTTLPVKRLFGIVRELADEAIELEVDDKDHASVTCGSSFYKIIGISEDEFPPSGKADGKYAYHLDQGVLKQMFRKTAYAASSDEAKYMLNSVLMSFKSSKLTVVATDGRRLALVEQEVEFPKEADADIILPIKAVAELMHVLGDEGEVKISTKDKQVMFEFKDTILISKVVEGIYPNYRQVIPAQCEQRVVVEREGLLSALRRVALLSTDRASATRWTFGKNKLVISISSPDVGEARETLPLKYNGKEISVAFNPEFMMDPLKTLTNDEVFIEMTDDLSPGVIKCDSPFLYVLMPMRIN